MNDRDVLLAGTSDFVWRRVGIAHWSRAIYLGDTHPMGVQRY